MTKPLLLMILDGWGINPDPDNNAVAQAKTPNLARLLSEYPHVMMSTSGMSVGLPEGQMGNSEVGHLNIGAGRIVYQDLTRIDKALEDGSLARNPVLHSAFRHARDRGKKLHFIGLLSPGGVHSHERHLHGMLRAAAEAGVPRMSVHAFLDGRDTAPRSARSSLETTESLLRSLGPHAIATVTGRYYAMDRDKRW